MELSTNSVLLLLISLIPVTPAQERPHAVLSVSAQSWLTEGDSVTLNCNVTDSSTKWTFRWFKHIGSYYLEELLDSSIGSGGSYTLSPAALKDTGVYMCIGEREERPYSTEYSNLQPLWISGESPPVSLIINPSRTQHLINDSLSLSCEDQSHTTGWRVRQYTDSEKGSPCPWLGSVTKSTCKINSLSTSHNGVYWCESKSGENSNPVNITVHGPSHVEAPSGIEAPFSGVMLINSVVTAFPYLLVTIILLIKCYRAQAQTDAERIENAVIEE